MSIKKKIALFITPIIIIAGAVVYLIILPTISDIKKISKDILNERVDLEKKYQRGQLLKKTIEDFEKIKPQQDKLTSAFLIFGQELTFITTLEKIATDNNLVQVIQLDFQGAKTRNDFEEIPIVLTVNGDFIKTMSYLQDLEKLSYYINLSGLKISSSETAKAVSNPTITTILSGKISAINPDKNKE